VLEAKSLIQVQLRHRHRHRHPQQSNAFEIDILQPVASGCYKMLVLLGLHQEHQEGGAQ
jgi:hypothetical protein